MELIIENRIVEMNVFFSRNFYDIFWCLRNFINKFVFFIISGDFVVYFFVSEEVERLESIEDEVF